LPKVNSELVGQTCWFAAAPGRAPPTISEMTFGNRSHAVAPPADAWFIAASGLLNSAAQAMR